MMPRYLYDSMPDNREVLFSNTQTCLADDEDSLYQVKTLNSCTCNNGNSTGSICTCHVPNIKDNIQLWILQKKCPRARFYAQDF